MPPSRSAACAALATALLLLPATGLAVSETKKRGSSCAKPLSWQIERSDFSAPEGDLDRGPVHARLDYPNGNAHLYTITASRGWRICRIHGSYQDGKRWALPGTAGSKRRKSFATRSFRPYGPRRERSFVVDYARRTPAEGSTCSAPRAIHAGARGDAGARIDAELEWGEDDEGRHASRFLARWRLGPGSELCYVKGWAFDGRPFTIRHRRDGSHAMDAYRSRGNHESPSIAYLVIAFRR